MNQLYQLLGRLTSIGRPLHPKYPSNLAIGALTTLAIIGGAIYRFAVGVGWLESIFWGFNFGFAIFLTWALARELDPDHPPSAFVAVGVVLIGALVMGSPALLPNLWFIITIRIINRTFGPPAKILDSLTVLGLSLWLTYQVGWPYGLMAALIFLLDAILPEPQRRQLIFAGAAALLTLGISLLDGPEIQQTSLTTPVVAGVVAAGAMFSLVITASRAPRTTADLTGERLNPRRVQTAQALGLLFSLLVVVWRGDAGLVDAIPLWSALLGTSLYQVFKRALGVGGA
jgi:hypothetical protein